MSKKHRQWTQVEKLDILKEAEVEGVAQTLRKHGIYSQTFYRWKRNFDMLGAQGLASKRLRVDPEKKELWEENQRLRQIIADQALEIKIKDELLKKTVQRSNIERK